MSVSVVVNQFDGGMVNDPRDTRVNVCRICKNFDAITNKHKLTPYRSSENGDSGSAANKIVNFVFDGTTLYGLGDTGSTTIQIFTRTAFANATWAAAAADRPGVATTNATRDAPFFIWYKKTGKLYGVGHQSRYVWSVTPGSTAAQQAADFTAYSNVSNGIVHSKDDILYVGYDNKIASNNNDSWTVAALTLPSSYIITAICEFQNYVAIGCRSATGGNSRVFLWDRNSSATTLAESIDWGEGDLKMLEELEGNLIGVSIQNSGNTFKSRLTFRYYSGVAGAVKFADFLSSNAAGILPLFHIKSNNRIFFPCSFALGGSTHEGVWSIGRSSLGVPFAVTIDRSVNNDTAMVNGLLEGIALVGDYMFQSYQDNSAWSQSKTDDVANYNATGLFETTINPNMAPGDRAKKKNLLSVGAMYEPLPAAGQVVVKYRVDGGAWTTIFTETTDNAVSTEPYTVDAAGAYFTDGKEFEFHVESTGGAEVTALTYKYRVLQTNV